MMIMLMVYIAMILAVLLFERKNSTEALLWVIILVCLPYFGMVLYLIFGDTMAIKITAYVRKKRLSKIPGVIVKTKLEDEAYYDLSMSDMEVIKFNGNYNNSELTCYDDVKIFTNGREHYQKLFEDIEKAHDCIYVEYYTIHNDEVGQAFVKMLTEKAKEGVKVFVMCDFIANIFAPLSMYAEFKKVGGMIVRVKPFFTHYRSHRKIVVIDHKIAYIGGMNIGRQYANMAKKKNRWRDTQVRMTGACCLVNIS